MKSKIKPLDSFKRNLESVQKLMNFDRDVQDMAINYIEKLHNSLVNVQNITNEQINGKRTLDLLKGIRENDSLRPRYKIIFNQAIVLLVSYFGSAITDCFRLATQIAVESCDKRVLDEELNLEIKELIDRGDQIGDVLGDLLIQKKDISFQDMKSTHRAFKKYFGIEINKDAIVNNIILGQACRHCIVHEGGRVNRRIIKQIENAKPRSLKPSVRENDQLNFSTEEVEELGGYMKDYVSNLEARISEYKNSINQVNENNASTIRG